MSSIISFLIFILIFGIIILIHEFGHFIAARKCGIYVEEFAMGMGPKLIKWTGKSGTLYSVRAFPIGGFCKMRGEDGDASDEMSFGNKSKIARFIVLGAGAFLNFLLAFVVFVGLAMAVGYADTSVYRVIEDSPASQYLQAGDRIVRIDGKRIHIYEDLPYYMMESKGNSIIVEVVRDGTNYEYAITPFLDSDGSYKLGFYPDQRLGVFEKEQNGFQRASFFSCITNGFHKIFYYIKMTVMGIVKLVTFQISPDDVSGPIGIATTVNEIYTETISQSIMSTVLTMLLLMAIISANIGAFNLLPLPALDGGRLIFILIEAVRRKPLNPEREGMIHFVGFVLFMILAVFVAFNDIVKIINR